MKQQLVTAIQQAQKNAYAMNTPPQSAQSAPPPVTYNRDTTTPPPTTSARQPQYAATVNRYAHINNHQYRPPPPQYPASVNSYPHINNHQYRPPPPHYPPPSNFHHHINNQQYRPSPPKSAPPPDKRYTYNNNNNNYNHTHHSPYTNCRYANSNNYNYNDNIINDIQKIIQQHNNNNNNDYQRTSSNNKDFEDTLLPILRNNQPQSPTRIKIDEIIKLFQKATTNPPPYRRIPKFEGISIGSRLFKQTLDQREAENQYHRQLITTHYDLATTTTTSNKIEISILNPLHELIVEPRSYIKFSIKKQALAQHQQLLDSLWTVCIKPWFVPHIIPSSYKSYWATAVTGGNHNRLHSFLNIIVEGKENVAEFVTNGMVKFNQLTRCYPVLKRMQIKLHPKLYNQIIPASTTTNTMTRQSNLKRVPSYRYSYQNHPNHNEIADMPQQKTDTVDHEYSEEEKEEEEEDDHPKYSEEEEEEEEEEDHDDDDGSDW